MIYFEIADIREINRRLILKTGGFKECAGHLLNAGSLEYVVKAVQHRMMGIDIYPSLSRKAAAYAYHIITRHIFVDGNKRTGMACALLFLRLNGCLLIQNIRKESVVELAVNIATGNAAFCDVVEWFDHVILENF